MKPNTVMKEGTWRYQETPLTLEQAKVAVHIGIGWMLPVGDTETLYRIDYGPPGGGEDVKDEQLDAYLEVEALKKLGVLMAVQGVVVKDGEQEEPPCKGCGGQGWYEGMEPDPRDPTGQTPMQVQIQCPCEGR